ncbi:MAG: phosphotransferase [Betaproteobacteria bacterium]|nr:phosphotransferase [Betaproteobacteria bacterium]
MTDPSADARLRALVHWLGVTLGTNDFTLTVASSDASFRRYFRASLASKHLLAPAAHTLIVMDAPPPMEDCRPFVHVARLLVDAGVHAPGVLAQDLAHGFLLLTDLGATMYLAALNSTTAPALYADALDALVRFQLTSSEVELPPYDEATLARELALFPDWYVTRHLDRTLTADERETLAHTYQAILKNNLAQPRVFVHRDYHSRNLMVSTPNPGVLDFQDAVYGPITYDLVSLLRDAYIEWDEERQLDWAVRYWERARKAALPVPADFALFWRDFEWMGVQRQLKVLGIFARLAYRDGKHGYLQDLPRVMRYLRAACNRYRELGPLAGLLDVLADRAPAVDYSL